MGDILGEEFLVTLRRILDDFETEHALWVVYIPLQDWQYLSQPPVGHPLASSRSKRRSWETPSDNVFAMS